MTNAPNRRGFLQQLAALFALGASAPAILAKLRAPTWARSEPDQVFHSLGLSSRSPYSYQSKNSFELKMVRRQIKEARSAITTVRQHDTPWWSDADDVVVRRTLELRYPAAPLPPEEA